MQLDITHQPDNIFGIVIYAKIHGETVGYLWLTGEFEHIGNGRFVRNIHVLPKYQRQGVATAMWDYAKTQGFNPTHDIVKTDAGRAWAEQNN